MFDFCGGLAVGTWLMCLVSLSIFKWMEKRCRSLLTEDAKVIKRLQSEKAKLAAACVFANDFLARMADRGAVPCVDEWCETQQVLADALRACGRRTWFAAQENNNVAEKGESDGN